MAKKGGSGDRRRKRQPAELPPLPDPRMIEEFLRQALGAEGGGPPGSPAAQAQQFLMQAYQEPDADAQRDLARKALTAWPDCADAYVLLAENAPTRQESLRFYEQAVAAGERALGSETFREHAGHFWLVPETRPYMRALLGLAHLLWTTGRRDEAVHRFQDLLRLNPSDNQGVRYILAGWLLALDRDADLHLLLEQYPDEGSAVWAYTKALLAFRKEGDTPESRKLLKAARKVNKHVPAYLLGEKRLPPEPPPAYAPGDASEAIHYAAGSLPGWKTTEGALAWLRQAGRSTRKKKTEQVAAVGPLPLVKERLKQLPQRADVWQAGARQLPVWVKVAGQSVRPWAALVVSETDDLILGHGILEEAPAAAQLWDVLADAVQQPLAGKPHRPTAVRVRDDPVWQELKPHLEEVGIRLELADDLETLDTVTAGLAQHIGGAPQPGLLEVPGMTPEQVGSFFEAAADYFRQAPWRRVGYESAIKVACDKYQGGPWYAVVMGQSGVAIGLAVYDDLKVLERMWSGETADEENAREAVATAVTFGEEFELPLADVEAMRQYGWTVARPDAYPSVYRKERGMSMRPPLPWELELVEACLRAIPTFMQRRPASDTTPETVTVRVASGEVKLILSWIAS